MADLELDPFRDSGTNYICATGLTMWDFLLVTISNICHNRTFSEIHKGLKQDYLDLDLFKVIHDQIC